MLVSEQSGFMDNGLLGMVVSVNTNLLYTRVVIAVVPVSACSVSESASSAHGHTMHSSRGTAPLQCMY